MHTLGSLKADVLDWLDESTIPDSRLNSACNDAIESLWGSLTTVCVSLFVNGPVGLTLSSGTEGVILVSVLDPTAAPALSTVVSGALASHSVSVKYTYVTESGTETLPSPVSAETCPDNTVALVTSPMAAANSIGWNCYANTSTPPVTAIYAKQNDEPLPFGADFQEPDSGFVSGPERPDIPTQNTTGDDICYIKHLEAQMPDMGYKQYDHADISSLLMRKAARNISTTSQYQNYYWDLINQRQLEFRPPLGFDMTPRYFYVKRPRRLRFDSAPLPFLTVPSTAFLRSHALKLLSISVREFDQAKAWKDIAEDERTRCELVVMQMNYKNDFITPFAP